MKKNLNNRTSFNRNYYAVSIGEQFAGHVKKVTNDEIKTIKETGQCEFTITYDYNDHKVILPCKIVIEEIETHKKYFEYENN